MTGRTGQAEQDRIYMYQNRIGRTGQQNKTDRTGQAEQER
jgi:hypothetical protein